MRRTSCFCVPLTCCRVKVLSWPCYGRDESLPLGCLVSPEQPNEQARVHRNRCRYTRKTFYGTWKEKKRGENASQVSPIYINVSASFLSSFFSWQVQLSTPTLDTAGSRLHPDFIVKIFDLRIASSELRPANWLQTVNCELWTSCKLWIANCESESASF